MVMGGFGGWSGFYILTYVLFIPVLNILLIPLLLVLIHYGKLERAVWKKFLIGNGFISTLASWWIFLIPSDVKMKIDYNVTLYKHIPNYVIDVGMTLQAIIFVLWLIAFFCKYELSSRFYKTWGWIFLLLYLLPSTISLAGIV